MVRAFPWMSPSFYGEGVQDGCMGGTYDVFLKGWGFSVSSFVHV